MKTLAERMAARPPISPGVWRKGFAQTKASSDARIDPTTIANVSVIRTSQDAVCVAPYGEEVWVPRSLLFPESVSEKGQKGALVVPEWLAERHGWV